MALLVREYVTVNDESPVSPMARLINESRSPDGTAAATIELPAEIHANGRLAQLLFFQGDGPCEVFYASENGK